MGYYTDIIKKINSATKDEEIKEIFDQVERQSPSIKKAADENRKSEGSKREQEEKKTPSIPQLVNLSNPFSNNRTISTPASSYLLGSLPTPSVPYAAARQNDPVYSAALDLTTGKYESTDAQDFAKSFAYGTEKTLAGAAGAVEDALRFASGYGNKLLSGITSLGGLADNPLSDFLSQTAENTLSGSYVDRWRQNIDERYQPTEFQQKLGGLNEAAGAMLPSIAASIASGGLSNAAAIGKGASMTAAGAQAAQDISRGIGLATMFPQVAGASTRQAVQEGANVDSALTYGALSGALELGTESLFAGIPGIGGGRVSQAVQNIIAKATKSPAVSKVADILGEGVEEVISGYVTPYLQRLTYNEQAELASNDELLENFISGVALSGIMQGGAGISGRIASRSVGQGIDVNSLGENSRKNYISQMERDGGTTRGFDEQWKRYNDAGLAGIPFDQVPGEPTGIGMPRAYAAHAAGMNDYNARQAQQPTTAETDIPSYTAPQSKETTEPTTYTPGLVQNGYTSSVSENTAKSIDSIAKKAGVTVEIADDVPAAGEYRDGVIRIHANAENPVRQVFVHELTHHLEQSDGYGELVDFYRANTEKSGVRLADLVRAKQEQYAEQGIQLTEDAAQREIIAEFCDTTLFTDERSIMRLAQEKRSLVQKIRDWMHEMRVRLRGTQQEKFILEAEKRYQKALDSVDGQKKNASGETQYMFSREWDENTRMRAEQMEREGASRADIWQTLGLIRDTKGNWVHEIDDSGMQYDELGLHWLRENERFRRLEELEAKAKATEDNFGFSDSEYKEWQTLTDEFGDAVWDDHILLRDYIRHDALFQKYPMLRFAELHFEPMGAAEKGYFDRATNTIHINERLKGIPQDTILHEIQHMLQRQEGRPGGATPEYWELMTESASDWLDRSMLQTRKKKIMQQMTEMEDQIGYSAFYDSLLDRELNGEITSEQVDELDAQFIAQHPAYQALRDELYNDIYPKLAALGKDKPDPMQLYRNTAGEIEARETAARRELTTDERRQKMPDLGWDRAVFAEDSGQNMEIDPDYQRNIDQWDSKGKPDGETFILGSTGDVLQGLGAIESDIYMRGDKIKKILHDHPEMTLHEIKKLPEILEDPVLILKSRNTGRTGKANSRVVVFGNVKAQNGQPVLTVLDLRPYKNRFLIEDMQKVNSAYTKDRGAASFFERSDIMYADKKRAAALLRRAGFQMPAGLLRYGSMGSISYENGGVKLHGVPFSEIISIENSESNQFKVNGSSYYDLLRRAGYIEQADALQRASGQYGTINRGEMPARDVQLPTQMDENTRVRRFARTAAESSILTDEQAGEIGKAVAEGRFNYEPITNKAARAHAESVLSRGEQYAQDAWDRVVNRNRVASKNDIAVGEYLLKQAAETGDTQRVVELTAQIAAEGTRAGQIVQAMSMLKRLDGVGQSIALDAMLKKMQGDLDRGKSGVFLKVPDHLREELVKAKGQEQVDKAMDKIYDSLAQQIPKKWSDKWNDWRYLAMLGNPRTHIRNVLGNAFFAPVVGTKNIVGAVIESGVYNAQRLAGKQGIERTKTIRGAIPFSGGKTRAFAVDDFSKVEDIIKGGGKMNPSDIIREKQRVFKFKPLESLRKLNFNVLEAEDGLFLKQNYVRSMVQYLQANKIDLDTFNPDGSQRDAATLQRARDYAIKEAQKATYRDFSRAAQAISNASRNAGGAANILIEGVLPFKKTPINVLKRGIEYSPAGLLQAITTGTNQLRKGEISANEFIDHLSAGMTGTGISLLGMLLFRSGLLVGGSGDDKEAEFRDSLGAQSYAIRLEDKTYTIDWLAPASMPLFVGAEIQSLADTFDGLDGRVVYDSILNLAEPMTKMSMLDGLNTSISSVRYGEDPLSDMAANAVIGYIGQAVPTLFGQIARTLDDTARTTYIEKNGSLPDSVQRALQKNRNKIPGLSNQSIAYRDVFGRAEKDTSMISRALKNFISPGYFSEEKIGSMESELIRVYQNTDDSGVLPSMPAKYFNVNGERKDLTAEEYEKFSYTRGSIMYSNLSELTETSLYKNLDDTDKASAISNVIELSNALAKTEVSDYQLEGWMADAKGAFDKGIKIPDFILIRDGASQIDSFKDEEGKTVTNSSSVRKAYYLLTETNLTPSQRSYMYEVLNVGKKVQKMSPDKVKAEYQKMYNRYGR